MRKYLDKFMKRCLSKEEREALFREHPRPNLDSCNAPKVDKFISEYLGKRLPREKDTELSKIQSAILAIIRPLTSAWQHLVEAKLEDTPDLMVPASEVLNLIQQTICLVGNASEFTSQIRRSHILGAIDTSWSKFSSDSFESATVTLFGEEFHESLSKKVEKESALSKAVSISKKSKKSSPPAFSSQNRQRSTQFFSRGPSRQVRRQTGQACSSVQLISSPTWSDRSQAGEETVQTAKTRPETPLPRAKPSTRPKNPTEETLDILTSLPGSNLGKLGIEMDESIKDTDQ